MKLKYTTATGGLPFLAALVPLVGLTIWWHAFNHQLPRSDAANFLEVADHVARSFDLEGFGRGLSGLYFHRGWRPISFPFLAVPFYWVGFGSRLLMVGVTMALLSIALAGWTYGCLRVFVSPWRAALGAAFCTTIPFYCNFSLNFFSDIAFLAFSIGAVFHLLQSRLLENRPHTVLFAVLLGLASTIRPAETVLCFAGPLLLLLWLGLRARTIAWKGVLAAAVVVGFGVDAFASQFVPVLSLQQLGAGLTFAVVACICALGAAALVALRLPRLVEAVSIIILVNVFWWLPFLHELVQWIFAASFGALAAQYSGFGHLNVLGAANFYVQWTARDQLIFLGALALLTIACCRPTRVEYANPNVVLMIGLPVLGLFGIIAASASIEASDPRRAMLPVALALIGLSSFVLNAKPQFRRLRTVAVCAALVVQLAFVFSEATGIEPQIAAALRPYLGVPIPNLNWSLHPPYREWPGPDERVAAFIRENVRGRVGVTVLDSEVDIAAANPFSLKILFDDDPEIWLDIPVFVDDTKSYFRNAYNRGVRYVLYNKVPDSAFGSPPDPAGRLTEEVIKADMTGRAERLGLRRIAEVQVPDKLDCVLLAIGRPVP